MTREPQLDPGVELLQKQLQQSETTPPLILELVEPEEGVRLLVALLIPLTQRDYQSMMRRWDLHRFKDPAAQVEVFHVHTPPWNRLVQYLLERLPRCSATHLVLLLFPLLQALDAEAHQEELPLEAALVRTLAEGLPYLDTWQVAHLPDELLAFLVEAIYKRASVHWQQRRPWMKADFVVAALLALATAKKGESIRSTIQRLAQSDLDARVREAALDYLV